MKTSTNKNHFKHALAAVVTLLVILAVSVGLLVWYVPNRPRPISEKLIKDRYNALAEHQATDQKKLAHYAWGDKKNKIVHLPIKRAMKLTVIELNQQQ